jgi:leucyl/phenylalanyl-tRNA--protein transferase
MVFRLLKDQILFPDPTLADEDGLLAVGGDLSTPRLLLAYQNGIFPWFSEDDPICWYSPHERCVIYPSRLKVSKSMAKIISKNVFKVTYNQNFEEVIANCANVERRDQPGTWITNEMQKAYLNLHKSGFAKSIEVWLDEELVGGLYGVEINDIFCGESMFSLVSNASKAAMIALCAPGKYELIDCQLPNDHLMSLGAEMISRTEYQSYLKKR